MSAPAADQLDSACFDVAGTDFIAPGWGCCRCRIYNGEHRELCKSCGHVRCALAALERDEPRCAEVYAGASFPAAHGKRCFRGAGHTLRNPDSRHTSGEGIGSGHVLWWSEAQKTAGRVPVSKGRHL